MIPGQRRVELWSSTGHAITIKGETLSQVHRLSSVSQTYSLTLKPKAAFDFFGLWERLGRVESGSLHPNALPFPRSSWNQFIIIFEKFWQYIVLRVEKDTENREHIIPEGIWSRANKAGYKAGYAHIGKGAERRKRELGNYFGEHPLALKSKRLDLCMYTHIHIHTQNLPFRFTKVIQRGEIIRKKMI